MNPPASGAPATGGTATGIRPAAVADLPAVRNLLSMRDDRPWDDASTRWFVRDLDPAKCLAWLAFVGDRPVGFSNMYVRDLDGPAGSFHVGYWANLFIDPAYRDRMLYPRLPLAMFAAAPQHQLAFVYASVRLPDLATAHTRIGVMKLGGFAVLAKPLRPARLIGKLFRQPVATLAAPPVDKLYGAWIELGRGATPRDVTVEEIDPGGATAESVVRLLQTASQGRLADRWTSALFHTRYVQTREGGRYHLLVARRDREVVAAVIFRIAERGDGILAGVIMDVIVEPGQPNAVLPALGEAERRARRAGGEVMIFLDGLGPEIRRTLRGYGYQRTREIYELMVWPKQALAAHPKLKDVSEWRMGFGDHDAF